MCSSHSERSPFGHVPHQLREGLAQVADERHVDPDVLVDLGRVDVDVDLAGAGRVGLHVAGDAVVEAHAEGQQQVRLLHGRVHPRLAVHAHHAEVQRVRGRDAPEPQQRHRDRDLAALREVDDRAGGARRDHALAGQDDGSFVPS